MTNKKMIIRLLKHYLGYKVTNQGKKKLLKRVLGKRTVGLKRTEIELKQKYKQVENH